MVYAWKPARSKPSIWAMSMNASSYRLAEQTLEKEELLTPEKRKPSGYAHPEIARELPEQTLLVDAGKNKK